MAKFAKIIQENNENFLIKKFITLFKRKIANKGKNRFSFVLTGGKSPIKLYKCLAKNKKIPISIIDDNNFQKNHGGKSGQNIMAKVSLTFSKSIDEIINNNIKNSKVLIVDKVQDPRNLGALIRSAESAGFIAIILSSNNAAKINSTVVESSSGAISLSLIHI